MFNLIKDVFKKTREYAGYGDGGEFENDKKAIYEGKSAAGLVGINHRKHDMTVEDVLDNLHRPFSNSELKYYPHHGLYKRRLQNGAITSTKGSTPVVPCGMGEPPPKKGELYIKEFWYEMVYNKMEHHTYLSNGKHYHSKATFPKITDSYLFGGIIKASNFCLDKAINEGKQVDLDFTGGN